jgi:hypothetical protein
MQQQSTSLYPPLQLRAGVLVVDGFGIALRVLYGKLRVDDGLGRQRRSLVLDRAGSGLERLALIGKAGSITLEALAWLRAIGAALVQIGRDGEVLAHSVPFGYDGHPIRRAQALAVTNGLDLAIVRELITIKLERAPQEPGSPSRRTVAIRCVARFAAFSRFNREDSHNRSKRGRVLFRCVERREDSLSRTRTRDNPSPLASHRFARIRSHGRGSRRDVPNQRHAELLVRVLGIRSAPRTARTGTRSDARRPPMPISAIAIRSHSTRWSQYARTWARSCSTSWRIARSWLAISASFRTVFAASRRP